MKKRFLRRPRTVDTNQNTGSSWMDCHRAASEPLDRLAAYALLLMVLRATNKEEVWPPSLLPIAGYLKC
jgi:hypothetical protein